MVPGALLPFLASLALCCTLLAGFADLHTILHKQAAFKRLAEVTIQVDVVGTRTTHSTTSFERRSSSTSRSSATSLCTT